MKNSKAIIAVVCALVLIFSLAACATQKAKTEEITQVVTDENGEVVTDKNGEALTEEIQAQIVTDANGKAVTEVVTDQNGKPLTTVKDNKYVNVTQVVTVSGSTSSETSQTSTTKSKKKSKSDKEESSTTKKASSVKAPDAITKLSASSIEKTSFKLSWNKVKCSGYYVMFSVDNGAHWSYFERAYTKTSYTAKNLISDQNYLIQVLAFNKSESGKVYKG
ncbi:MAG: fibronectin type III domain-containing protein, partial [Eubacterium sp.]|nr:fibronectin type III domain-containing protein [Eubacterium sp.]